MLADIESAQARNKSFEEIKVIVGERAKMYMPLSSDTARSVDVEAERKKDQYSHFVLRLAFCRSCVHSPMPSLEQERGLGAAS